MRKIYLFVVLDITTLYITNTVCYIMKEGSRNTLSLAVMSIIESKIAGAFMFPNLTSNNLSRKDMACRQGLVCASVCDIPQGAYPNGP